MDPLTEAVRAKEVRRLLERYLVEVVEAWALCPWAYGARQRRELQVEICWGSAGNLAEACTRARRALELSTTRVAMIVFPELGGGRAAIEALREGVARHVPSAGIASFGPHGCADLSTPAKLIPLLRCSPDPMLQLVPFSVLDDLRQQRATPDLSAQARALVGLGGLAQVSMVDSIALRNHAALSGDGAAALQRTLADIARDRVAGYARVGILVGAPELRDTP
jgi:hypothetical protein